jgi:hypothetical protein
MADVTKILLDTVVCVKTRVIKLNTSPHRCSGILVESVFSVWSEMIGRATIWLFWTLSYLLISLLYKFYVEWQTQPISLIQLVGWSWYGDEPFGYVSASMGCVLYTSGLSFGSYIIAAEDTSKHFEGLGEQSVERLLQGYLSQKRFLLALFFYVLPSE